MLQSRLLTPLLLALVLGAWLAMRWSSSRHRADSAKVHAEPPSTTSKLAQTIHAFALQDWVVTCYVAALWIAVYTGGGDRQAIALQYLTIDAVVFMCALFAARGPFFRPAIASAIYRFALPGAIVLTFSQLHYILPSARGVSFDREIYEADIAIFGFEPAEAWDKYVNPRTTEWFSFFYYSYFAIVLGHVLPMAFLERRMEVLREFSWGIFWVFCVGQLFYIVVPGYGPYRYLGPHLQNDLQGATWWPLVASAVGSFDGVHRTDIFPSLHTATPTFFSLFSLRHRKKLPFKYTAPVLIFFNVNIIIATMFLRWHYLLDICAGLLLATTAFLGSRWIPIREDLERARQGTPPIWSPLTLPWSTAPTPPKGAQAAQAATSEPPQASQGDETRRSDNPAETGI